MAGFELPLNKELLGVNGRGLRDSDSLNDDIEEQDEVVYAELLLNTLMRERSEVFGQAERSLLYRSMLNQKKPDNATAGPKFISSDQQEQAEMDENDIDGGDEAGQTAALDPAPLGQLAAGQSASKFDPSRYFKPTITATPEDLYAQDFQGLPYDYFYQQLYHQQWPTGPYAPADPFLPPI